MGDEDQRVSQVHLVSGHKELITTGERVDWQAHSLVEGEADANGPFLVCYDKNGRIKAEYRRSAIVGYGFKPADPGERVVDKPPGT